MKFKTVKAKKEYEKYVSNQEISSSFLTGLFVGIPLFITFFYSIKLALIWFFVSMLVMVITIASSKNIRLKKEELVRDGVLKI